MLNRVAVLVYGVLSYAISLVVFLYLAAFLGNFGIARSIDSQPQVSFLAALGVNLLLLLVFALQHSIMARPWFKALLTRAVPTAAERSTYVVFSCAALALLFWKWQPMGGVIWNVGSNAGRSALMSLYAVGWITVLLTTFLINHFDLFGLRQVWLHFRGRHYTHLKFRTPGPYRLVRHPLYVGWLMVFWSAPLMTSAHFVFALVTTVYILVAIRFEERDLVRTHHEYAEYRRRVPMIVPFGSSRQAENAEAA